MNLPEKYIVVPDLHGKKESCFNAISLFEEGDYSQIIFLGDYCDSYDRNTEDMLSVLKMIVTLKEKYPDKVFLLIGNHELHYMYDDGDFTCSGFSAARKAILRPFFDMHRNLFQVAHQIDKKEKKCLFTHAGVCSKWVEVNLPSFKNFCDRHNEKFDIDNFALLLNRINQTSYRTFLHQVGIDRGGVYPVGGITWCDCREMLQFNPIKGFHQYVGHTPQKFIRRVEKFNGSHYNNTSVTFCDVLGNEINGFLEIEI